MSQKMSIQSVIHNFLETFTSRYADRDGYWAFGMIVKKLTELEIDLLAKAVITHTGSSEEFIRDLAQSKFSDQLTKSQIPFSRIRSAFLRIVKGEKAKNLVNGIQRSGWNVEFKTMVVTDTKRTLEERKTLFVAPHDPWKEFKSTR